MNKVNNQLNILFISHSAVIGGAEKCLFNLLKYIDRKRYNPFVIFPDEGPLKNEIDSLNVRTYISPVSYWIYFKQYKGEQHWHQITYDFFPQVDSIVRIIESEKIDIVHTNTSVIWPGAFAAKIAGVPHLWQLHEILDNHPTFQPYHELSTVYALFNVLSDRLVVVSRAIEEKLAGHVSPEKIVFIPNGIETENFQSSARNNSNGIRAELGLTENDILVGAVGNIMREKGYDCLIEAAHILRKKLDNVNFIVAGGDFDQALTDQLKNSVSTKGLDGSFHFLGKRNDIPLLLRDIDLYVNSSLTEASPLSVIEAMAAGKPVVASDCGGVGDIVIDRETGFLVKAGDSGRLAEAIYNLLINPEQMNTFGRKGAERAQKVFDVRMNVSMIQQQYEQLFQDNIKERRISPDPILRIMTDVICSLEREIHTQREEILHLKYFVENIKRTKVYRLYKWMQRLRNN